MKKRHGAGRRLVWDPFRKKNVIGGPEEPVRKAVAGWLSSTMKYRNVCTEVALATRLRPDIVAFADEDRTAVDVVVECKKPKSFLDDAATLKQLQSYVDELKPRYALLACGCPKGKRYVSAEGGGQAIHYRVVRRRNGALHLREIPHVPSLPKLLKGFKHRRVEKAPFRRWTFEEIATPELAIRREGELDAYVLGADSRRSNPWILPVAMDLFGFLADSRTKVKSFSHKKYLFADLGRRPANFGNPSGGRWPSKYYRAFLVRIPPSDRHGRGRDVIASFAVISQQKKSAKSPGGASRGDTVLVVGIEDDTRKHLSLELKLDKALEPSSGALNVYHSGRMTGPRGGVPTRRTLKRVRAHAADLIEGDRVLLGSVPAFDTIAWTDVQCRRLIGNLVRYALLRDDLRSAVAKELADSQ